MDWIAKIWNNVPGPPFHIGFLVLGIIVNIVVGWKLLPETRIGFILGWPVILVGVLSIVWAVWTIRDMDISKPTRLVISGPYAFSRNPMYVACAAIYMGIALVVNTLWPIIFLPVVLLATHYFAILHEEHYLEESFGDAYRKYKERVRRYL